LRKSDNIEPEVTHDAICPLAIFSWGAQAASLQSSAACRRDSVSR